jgi:hypothetical protein
MAFGGAACIVLEQWGNYTINNGYYYEALVLLR